VQLQDLILQIGNNPRAQLEGLGVVVDIPCSDSVMSLGMQLSDYYNGRLDIATTRLSPLSLTWISDAKNLRTGDIYAGDSTDPNLSVVEGGR
jgi:hypothetical protein